MSSGCEILRESASASCRRQRACHGESVLRRISSPFDFAPAFAQLRRGKQGKTLRSSSDSTCAKVPTAPANVRALSEGPVRVEFNLKAIAAGKKPKQWAWIVEQGSHIGGRWVEVDERMAAGIDRAAKLNRAAGLRGQTQPGRPSGR
jgi:hypothetical protein